MREPSKIVVAVQGLTALIAVAAMIVSLTSINGRLDDIQTSRMKAAIDSCRLLRTIIDVAAKESPHSKKDAAKVKAFISSVGLNDCVKKARIVVNH